MGEQGSLEEPESLEDVYRVYSGMVYGVALRMTGTPQDAEEITQDVFVAAYRNMEKFERRSSLKTWLYRITVNTALNAIKRNKRRRVELRMEEGVEFEDKRQDAAEAIDRETGDAIVKGLLEQLSPDQRACLLLRAKEGLSYREISDVLKLNINTVRTRLKRARQALMALRRERS